MSIVMSTSTSCWLTTSSSSWMTRMRSRSSLAAHTRAHCLQQPCPLQHRADVRTTRQLTTPTHSHSVLLMTTLCPSGRLSVCLSVTSQHCTKTTVGLRIQLVFFGIQLPYIALCFKEIQVSPKIRVVPSGTLSQTRQEAQLLHRPRNALVSTNPATTKYPI